MLALKVGGVPVDLVKYPYPLLEKPLPGPKGVPVAGLRDLAAMKLAAIARRGIKRDFWDLYEIARAGVSLTEAARAYRRRFGRSEADLYHVQRALTWFEDAETDPRAPAGLTPALWKRIKAYFREEAPRLFEV
ncbi:MAG: nucleotidyl transferase AbiEii/AbiGii toxin family protein [Myxococcota bacterium]